MNKRQKLVQEAFLNNEEAVIRRLKTVYNQSLKDIEKKAKTLQDDINRLETLAKLTEGDEKEKVLSMQQSKVYQKQYQDALKKQVSSILDNLQVEEFKTVDEYLQKCYEEGFLGTMYDLHGQGISLAFPLDQEAMVRAVQVDSKISEGLYSRLGEDVELLKRRITAQVSRGISVGMTFQQVAKQLSDVTNIGFNNAVRIARTEGHRLQVQSGMDACYKAKEKGADVVKQWDASMDKRTRDSHAKVDGEIRELDEPFSNGLMFPGDPKGGAAEVVNCRCALLQRAKWALDDDELETLKKRAEYFELDKNDSFEDFKKKYLKYSEDIEKISKSDKIKEKGINLGELEDDYGKKHVKAIRKYLENAPEEIQNVWNACADDFHVLLRRRGERGAYYSPSRNGVSLSITTAAKGSSHQTPYQVVFHEYGHHADYVLNDKFGVASASKKAFSETYKEGIFGKTLKQEANDAIEQFAKENGVYRKYERGELMLYADKMVRDGLIEPSEKIKWIKNNQGKELFDRKATEKAFCEHIKNELTLIQRGDISDMFEPVMDNSNSYPFGVGHGSSYWNNRDNGKEGFAEMFSAMVNNHESLEQIKRFFPKSYEIFIEMLGVIE